MYEREEVRSQEQAQAHSYLGVLGSFGTVACAKSL